MRLLSGPVANLPGTKEEDPMNVNSTATPTLSGAPKHGAGRLILAVAGGVFVLAVAFGIAWAYRGNDAPLVTAPGPELDVSIPGPSTVHDAPQDWTLYVVGSEQEAIALRAGLDEANLIRAMTGQQSLSHSVMVLSQEIPLYELPLPVSGRVVDARTP